MSQGSFRDFVMDQLADVRGVECRAMFGGHGLYLDDAFFGIIFKEQLFFKVNDATRRDYERMGSKTFKPNPKQTLKSFYEVPVDVMEDRQVFTAWAMGAVQAALTAGKKKGSPVRRAPAKKKKG